MKTFSITTLSVAALLLVHSQSVAQTSDNVRKIITQSNQKFKRCFNNGQVDSLISLYHYDACLEGRGCGRDFIRGYYEKETKQYKLLELATTDLIITNKVARETGRLKIALPSGLEIPMTYTTEWKLAGNQWVIVKDMLPMPM